jgi:hypothetical protein
MKKFFGFFLFSMMFVFIASSIHAQTTYSSSMQEEEALPMSHPSSSNMTFSGSAKTFNLYSQANYENDSQQNQNIVYSNEIHLSKADKMVIWGCFIFCVMLFLLIAGNIIRDSEKENALTK